jgi:MFS family permease
MLTRAVRAVAVDIGALRESPAFRRLWTGQLISTIGRQITTVAVPYQVFLLTRSPLAVGAIGIAQAVPLIVVSIGAGPISDRFDRRRILIATQIALAACSALLAVGALSGHPAIAIIYVLVVLISALSALDYPARAAIIPNLVSRERLPGALSLNFALYQATFVAGPAIGGLVIARVGLSLAYLIDVATFAAALFAVIRLPAQPSTQEHHDPPLLAIKRGLQFARHQPVILGGFAMDLCAMIFGMPRALFPVLAINTFHSGAQAVGLLYAAPGAGGLLGALLTGWLQRFQRLGKVIVFAIIIWGVAIIAFGFATSLWLAVVFLAVAGAADSLSAVCRTTIMQTIAPDELRGRLSALYLMVVNGGPYLGDLEAGAVASAWSVQISIVSGGALCLVGLAVAAIAFPAVWLYRSRAPEGVVPVAGDVAAQAPEIAM